MEETRNVALSPEHNDAEAVTTSEREQLEIERLSLENTRLRKGLETFGRLSRADIMKMAFTFLGIIVPALITVLTFLGQQRQLVEQREEALRAERTRDIEKAWARIKQGERASGILQLTLYGEGAIPHLISQVKAMPIDSEWPAATLAALTALKHIGVNKLSEPHKDYLRNQAELSVAELERMIANLLAYNEDMHPKDAQEIRAELQILREILTIVDVAELGAEEARVTKIMGKAEAILHGQPQ